MSWLLFEDDNDRTDEVTLRWVLASLYYGWEGDTWSSAEGWLGPDHICEWEFIKCDFLGNVQELELSKNNLIGTIPNELIMLGDIQSIWLDGNKISGTIPGNMLGDMPKLSILYLNDNELTGTIPKELDKNGQMSKCLWIAAFRLRFFFHTVHLTNYCFVLSTR